MKPQILYRAPLVCLLLFGSYENVLSLIRLSSKRHFSPISRQLSQIQSKMCVCLYVCVCTKFHLSYPLLQSSITLIINKNIDWMEITFQSLLDCIKTFWLCSLISELLIWIADDGVPQCAFTVSEQNWGQVRSHNIWLYTEKHTQAQVLTSVHSKAWVSSISLMCSIWYCCVCGVGAPWQGQCFLCSYFKRHEKHL